MAALTNVLENILVDWYFRGVVPTLPANLFFGLMTTAPSDTGPGTEVSGGAYARVSVARSLANFAGTQAAGSTVASTGTSGTTSNNTILNFPAPTADWGNNIGWWGIWDAATGGNLHWYGTLGNSKSVNNGDAAPQILAGQFTFQFDN